MAKRRRKRRITFRGAREDTAKVIRTIRKVARQGSCLSAKLLYTAARRERMLSPATTQRLATFVSRCYAKR